MPTVALIVTATSLIAIGARLNVAGLGSGGLLSGWVTAEAGSDAVPVWPKLSLV